jgi:hypothetical protein
MKKAIFSIGLMLCVAIGANAQETTTPNPVNPNAPKFKFESEVIDYGTIEHNADGNREFKFTNTGKEPLIISNAVGSCGCTTPTWPHEPIKPGATAVIKVHYATDRVGQFEKTVTLTSNADTPSKVIKIKGVVKPDPTPAPTTTPVPPPAEQKH